MTSYHTPANLETLTKEELINHIELAYKWLKKAEPAINFYAQAQTFIKTCGIS